MKQFLPLSILLFTVQILTGCSAVYYRMGGSLTPVDELLSYDTSQSGKVFSADGTLVGDYAVERSDGFKVTDLPPHVKNAFLAAEDKLFFEHDGVDLQSLIGAVIGNFTRAREGRRLAGASTITMQVAKNLMLSDVNGLERKFAEVVQSLQLESLSPKDRILEIYLSDVFFGERSKGLAAAANAYFAKSAVDLTIAEAAMLAALPKSPVQFNPYRFPEEALDRRNWIISQMLENEYISEEEAEIALAEKIVLKRGEFDRNITFPYFTNEVRRSLDAVLGDGGFAQSGYSVVSTMDPGMQAQAEQTLRDGLIAYDRRHGWRGALGHITDFLGDQDQEALAFGYGGTPATAPTRGDADFRLTPLHQLAFNQIDPPSSLHDWTLGMVTSIDTDVASFRMQDERVGQIFRNTIGWARPVDEDGNLGRKPRSMSDVIAVGDLIAVSPREDEELVFDLQQIPLVNGGMIAMEPTTGRVLAVAGGWDHANSKFNRATQAQRQPGSTFKPVVYLAALEAGLTPGRPVSDDKVKLRLLEEGKFFEPKNSDSSYSYSRPLYQGLESSRNMMTLHLMGQVGRRKVEDYAQLMHMNTALRREFAAALGTAETTVLRVATAYSSIANGGSFVRPRFVDSVKDRFGRVLFDAQEANCYRQDCLNLRWFSKPPSLEDDKSFSIAEPRSIWQLTAMLRGVVERGTGRRVGRQLNFDLAGKTGTTNDVKDAWFVGFTPSLVVAVYVGFDTPRALGEGEQGATIAAPIVANFFEDVPDQYKTPFRRPEGVRAGYGVGRSGLIATQTTGSRIDGFGRKNLAEQLPPPSTKTAEAAEGGTSTSTRSSSSSRSQATSAASSGGFGDVF